MITHALTNINSEKRGTQHVHVCAHTFYFPCNCTYEDFSHSLSFINISLGREKMLSLKGTEILICMHAFKLKLVLDMEDLCHTDCVFSKYRLVKKEEEKTGTVNLL